MNQPASEYKGFERRSKLRLVAESNEPGALIRAVAARNDVSASLLFTWRRLAREGLLAPARASPKFLPVQTIKTAAITPPAAIGEMTQTGSQTRPALSSNVIEIELGNGRRIRVGSDVNLVALRRVLAALGA